MSEEKSELIRERLVIDEDELFKEMLSRVANYLRLDGSGRVYVNKDPELRQKDTLILYLMGKRLAMDAKLSESDIASIDEIIDATAIKRQNVMSRISDMKREGKVEVLEKGKYRVVFARSDLILDDIEKNLKKEG